MKDVKERLGRRWWCLPLGCHEGVVYFFVPVCLGFGVFPTGVASYLFLGFIYLFRFISLYKSKDRF